MPVPLRCSNLAMIAVAAILEAATFGMKAQGATPGHSALTPGGDDAAGEVRVPKRTSLRRLSPKVKSPLDRSGKKRFGKASFYAHMFAGRKMADGKRMDPAHNNAASRTLPIGTTAKVTNLETGKSAVVRIQDRGPYVEGRIVDLSPATAKEIGITHRQGVAKVEVAPIAVPLPNGGVKLGVAAGEVRLAGTYRYRQFPPVGW
ncbi:MAG TPA: septal ring lytic transglycosylase RlpA family protein [Steroidobacteraceae bacterium]|jgi:rare lipoprotein A|nr:septal ring lytic transglycosylase RlpA family protein [Steroidobacteraceae bacterium]